MTERDQTTAVAASPHSAEPSRRYQLVLILVLLATFSVGFADRQILNLLVEPIKADFGLSDVEISLLQGMAFSAGYLVCTPLLGRLVDILPRTWLLAGAVSVWSLFTALCAAATGFLGLAAARAGVGAAEGALTPSVYSLLGDSFRDRELAVAFSVVLAGPYIGGGAALLAGGFLMDVAQNAPTLAALFPSLRPWQFVFIVMSVPGLLCALALILLREPARTDAPGREGAMPLSEVREEFRRQSVFYLLFFGGMSLLIIPIYAFPAWVPAFMGRRFGMSVQDVGYAYGLLTLGFGIGGVLSGPWLARLPLLGGKSPGQLRFVSLCGVGVAACCGVMFAAETPGLALGAAGLASFFYSAPTALAAAVLQIATPPRMRGVASSAYVVISTITGLMLAPTLVAALTQYVFADERQVGTSLALVAGLSALASAVTIVLVVAPFRKIVALRASQAGNGGDAVSL